jgi:Na+-transporting methylmalonyl-CoA/oxaloacetate decarboxylase gamma subunit
MGIITWLLGMVIVFLILVIVYLKHMSETLERIEREISSISVPRRQ